MLFALRENLRREHAIDLKKLEFDSIAARIRGRIDKSECARQVLCVVARSFRNKQRPFHDLLLQL
jgi:hypothetical protein